MGDLFLGNEALSKGLCARYDLVKKFEPVHHNVYLPKGAPIGPRTRAEACWLWTRGEGILAGFSASALHGSRWIDPARNAEVIYGNRRPPRGVSVWTDAIGDDEVVTVDGLRVTNAERTALDLACRHALSVAVAAIDALSQATNVKPSRVAELAERYAGRRGIRRARRALDLVDGGAQSPKETWLRLVLIAAGLPRPTTQIVVHDGGFVPLAYIDMGWEDMMVGVEYDGDQHRADRRQYVKDIKRMELLEGLGWRIVRVVAEDHPDDIIRRVHEALSRRK